MNKKSVRNLLCAAAIAVVIYLIARSLNLVEFMENKDEKEMSVEEIIKSPKALMDHKIDLIGLATAKGIDFEKLDKVIEANDKKALKKLFS